MEDNVNWPTPTGARVLINDGWYQTAPAQLFYDFCPDDHVPADHLLRGIDRHLDLGGQAAMPDALHRLSNSL